MLTIDLHCHSTVSDGTLTPAELVAYAAARGIRVLALTDHDNVEGLAAARLAAQTQMITLINGVEISTTWRNHTIHVVGLNIDPNNHELCTGLNAVRSGRQARAQAMADDLAQRAGIFDILPLAYEYAGHPDQISRTHFARALVTLGKVKEAKAAFNKYLVPGKPGYIKHEWTSIAQAIAWIHAAGGVAVLAHPARYALNPTALASLMSHFIEWGGQALEVVTSNHSVDDVKHFAQLTQHYGLQASCGSDFHSPSERYADMGRLTPLPTGCVPVWQHWNLVL